MKGIAHLGMVFLLVGVVSGVHAQDTPTPTVETPTETATATPSPTLTFTPTPTASPSATTVVETATATATTTWTPVVATVVVTSPPLIITAPPVIVVATSPPLVPTVGVTAPPILPTVAPIERPARASASGSATPFYGWTRFQSIHLIGVMGTWSIQPDPTASARQFRRSSSAHALARFPFQGDGVQLVYGQHALGCAFEVGIDGQVVDIRHAYSETHAWTLAGPYFTTNGYHVLDVRSLSDVAQGCALDIDYLEVFTSPPTPESWGGTPEAGSRSTSAQPVSRVRLVSAPPTALPRPTVLPSGVVTLAVQVAYDANASQSVDLDEGIRGVSVRVVSEATGEHLASGLTDERGVLRVQVVTREAVVAHLPLLGETLTIRPSVGTATTQTWTVLLPPANHPAVIP